MARPLKDRCVRGHSMSEAFVRPDGKGRRCRECARECARESRGTRERFCRRMGHDTWATGRYPNGHCRECNLIQAADKRIQARKGMVAAYHLLVEIRASGSDEAAIRGYAERWHTTRYSATRALLRLRHSGDITIDTADRWCLALGTHLAIVYPEVYGLNPRPVRRAAA